MVLPWFIYNECPTYWFRAIWWREHESQLGDCEEAIKRIKPGIVLSLGLAGKIADITVEKIAIKVMDATHGDNKGQKPVDGVIVDGGKEACFVTIPPSLLAKELHSAEIPASTSYGAGFNIPSGSRGIVAHHTG